jgi:aminopeptidase N
MRLPFRLFAAFAAASLLIVAADAAPKPHPRPFGRGKAAPHPRPIPGYAIQNQDVAVSFDVSAGIVYGATRISLVDTSAAPTVAFDSLGLSYTSVTIDGAPAMYLTDDDHLTVTIPKPDAQTVHTIVAVYRAKPTRGIYFVRQNAAYPHRAPEIWTQGETIDTRRWMPTWDQPNMKFTTSVAAVVPASWTVISNGALVSDAPRLLAPTPGPDQPGKVTRASVAVLADSADPRLPLELLLPARPGDHVVTWRESHPHSSYLTSFVAGPYVKTHESLGALPVDFYVHPGDEAMGKICFGNTPQIVAFFQDFTHTPYPWEKYAQTTVQEFTAGGMENVSATTQTAFALHPKEFDLEAPCDGLVSHELAHQWFGDDVTTADWGNIWINEGWATYFQELWFEHKWGEDAFDYERYHAQQAYFRETRRYWRPIVDNDYGIPQDTFDSSGYPRPAQVLNMLRNYLGDAMFRNAIHDYLAANTYQNTDTRIFEASVEKTFGHDLSWFFNEWFTTASYPNYIVTERYDATRGRLNLDIKQQNHGGVLFMMPITVTVTADGKTVSKTFLFAADRGGLVFDGIKHKPQMVLFDAGNEIIRTLHDKKSVADLAYQAANAPSVADRLWAIGELGHAEKADATAARAAVRRAVTGDRFWGVRVDALDAAASLDDAGTLVAALGDRDPRVVIAAARATGSLDHPGAPALVAALRRLTSANDWEIRSAALAGYGATKAPDAKAILLAALDVPSPQAIGTRGALDGLGALGDPATIPALIAKTRYGLPERVRTGAIAALGTFAKLPAQRGGVVPLLKTIASSDPYFRARGVAVAQLAKTADKRLIPFLTALETSDTEEGVQAGAWDAVADINDPPDTGKHH